MKCLCTAHMPTLESLQRFSWGVPRRTPENLCGPAESRCTSEVCRCSP